jgi:hypothetical protein
LNAADAEVLPLIYNYAHEKNIQHLRLLASELYITILQLGDMFGAETVNKSLENKLRRLHLLHHQNIKQINTL